MTVNNNVTLITGDKGPHKPAGEGYGLNVACKLAEDNKRLEEDIKEDKVLFNQFMKSVDKSNGIIPLKWVLRFPRLQKINDYYFNKHIKKTEEIQKKMNVLGESITKYMKDNFIVRYSKPQEKIDPDKTISYKDEKGQLHQTPVNSDCLFGLVEGDLNSGAPIPEFLKNSTPVEQIRDGAAVILIEDMLSKKSEDESTLYANKIDGTVTKEAGYKALGLSMNKNFWNLLIQTRKIFGLDEKAEKFIKTHKNDQNKKASC